MIAGKTKSAKPKRLSKALASVRNGCSWPVHLTIKTGQHPDWPTHLEKESPLAE